jgi:hypothetical protein
MFGIDVVTEMPPPVATTLPDKFVFRLVYTDGKKFRSEVGNPIKQPLTLGFDYTNEENTEIDWLFNFDKAVESGMGIKIQLTEEEYKSGFSKLIVLGVKTASFTR